MEIMQGDVKTAIRNLNNWNLRITGGTYLTAVAALEKQVAKKPVREPAVWPDGCDYVRVFCPICHEDLSRDEKYCSECGQHLDWSENDG